MSRLNRVSTAPREYDPRYMQEVADAINSLPWFKIVNGSPSGTTGPEGAIAINIASGSTQRLWINTSGTTSSWSYVQYL